MIPIIHT